MALHEVVDEEFPDDNDCIGSIDDPVSDTCELLLSEVETPTTREGHALAYRYKKVGSKPINLTVRLLEGGSEIATWDHIGITTEWIESTQILTVEQAQAISDYSNLRVEFTAALA